MTTKLKEVKAKPRGKPFKKGNSLASGNKMSDEQKLKAKLTRTQLRIIIRKFLYLNKPELVEVVNDANTNILELMVASVMNKAIVQGDEKRINWFLEQLFGKLKEKQEVQITGEINTKPNYHLKNLSDADLLKLKEIAAKAEAE